MPLLSSNLPGYAGKFGVGLVDIETPCERRQFSDLLLRDSALPAFELETVLFSLYYPTSKRQYTSTSKHYWVPKPISHVAEGYARFAHMSNALTNRVFAAGLWLLAGGTQIPASVDVSLLGVHDIESGLDEGKLDSFPIVVFSHGMASSRTHYSQYLGELASNGYVVAAIEHRDGSGPASLVHLPNGSERVTLHFGMHDIQHEETIDEAGFKHHQLAMRQAEVEETIRVLRLINDGHGYQVFTANPLQEGRELENWAGRLDFDTLVVGGHSYGATLALQTLQDAPSNSLPIKGAIILDPGKHSGPLNDDIKVPTMVVNSDSWSKKRSIYFGRTHFEVVKQLVEGVLKRGHPAWFLTSLGTSHPSVTDAPLIEPTLLSWTTGSTISARDGIREYVKVSLEFLAFLQTGAKNGILAKAVTHPEYDKSATEDVAGENMGKVWQIHVAPTTK